MFFHSLRSILLLLFIQGNSETITLGTDTCSVTASGIYSIGMVCNSGITNTSYLYTSFGTRCTGPNYATPLISLPNNGNCISQLWIDGSTAGFSVVDSLCTPTLGILTVCTSSNCSTEIHDISSSSNSSTSSPSNFLCTNRTVRLPTDTTGSGGPNAAAICTRITPIYPPVLSSWDEELSVTTEVMDAVSIGGILGIDNAVRIEAFPANGTLDCGGSNIPIATGFVVPLNSTCTVTDDSYQPLDNKTTGASSYSLVPYSIISSSLPSFNVSQFTGPVPSSNDLSCYIGLGNIAVAQSNGPIKKARFCAVSNLRCTSINIPGCTSTLVNQQGVTGPLYQGLSALQYITIKQNLDSQSNYLYPNLQVCSRSYCNVPLSPSTSASVPRYIVSAGVLLFVAFVSSFLAFVR